MCRLNQKLIPNPHRSLSTQKGLGKVSFDDADPEEDASGLPEHVLDVLEEVNSESRVVLPKQFVDPSLPDAIACQTDCCQQRISKMKQEDY